MNIQLITSHMSYYRVKAYKYILKAYMVLIYGYRQVLKLCRKVRNILYHLYHRLKLKIKRYYKEILLILAFVTGWILFTHGIGILAGEWFYYLSYGILLLGLVGFKFICKIFVDGLYTLSADEGGKG